MIDALEDREQELARRPKQMGVDAGRMLSTRLAGAGRDGNGGVMGLAQAQFRGFAQTVDRVCDAFDIVNPVVIEARGLPGGRVTVDATDTLDHGLQPVAPADPRPHEGAGLALSRARFGAGGVDDAHVAMIVHLYVLDWPSRRM